MSDTGGLETGGSENGGSENGGSRNSAMPILIALGVVGIVLITMVVLRMVNGDRIPDDAAVGRAVVAQNDALQRSAYPDFQRYTCAAEQRTEAEVLAAQRQSEDSRGPRYVDDVTSIAVTGDRATASVVYHFEKAPDDKVNAPMTFAREGGEWKVCSAGPR